MSDDLKDTRVQIVMSRAELVRLDDWRAGQQIWSRSAAIRQLIAYGLDRADAKARKAPAGAGKSPRKAPRAKQ